MERVATGNMREGERRPMTRKSARSYISDRRGDGVSSATVKRSIKRASEASGQRLRKFLEEQQVTARIVQFVYDRYGPGTLTEAWDEFCCSDPSSDIVTPLKDTGKSPSLKHFTSWLVYTWRPGKVCEGLTGAAGLDRVSAQTFLAERPGLDSLLAKYLGACIETPFSFFEIVNSEVGRKLACRDLISGIRHVVFDDAAAMLLCAHQVVYARIVVVKGTPIIDAVAPWSLPEDATDAILSLRKMILEGLSGPVERQCAWEQLPEHELDVRNFYWGFVKVAIKDGSLLRKVKDTRSIHKAAERLLITLLPRRTAAELALSPAEGLH